MYQVSHTGHLVLANPSNLHLAQHRMYEENLQSILEAEQEIDVWN